MSAKSLIQTRFKVFKNIVKSINRLKKELDLIKSLINKKDKKLFKYFENIKLKLEINDK